MIKTLVLVVLNVVNLAVALLVGEYELSKHLKPEASWLVTPVFFDLTVTGVVALLTIINLAVLVFVVLRQLDHHRTWLWWTTVVGCILLASMALVLGPRFLPILWPTL